MYWCVTSELGDRQAVVIVTVLIVKTLQYIFTMQLAKCCQLEIYFCNSTRKVYRQELFTLPVQLPIMTLELDMLTMTYKYKYRYNSQG